MSRYLKFIKREWANISFRRPLPVRLDRAVVSFTFDDAPGSAFEHGGRILHENGCEGTFYVSLSFLHSQDSMVAFTREHLCTAVEQGHEIGCHTYGHIHLSREKLAAIDEDICHNQTDARALFPNLKLENFSYPFGEQTRTAKALLSAKYRSARGVGHGLNARQTDLYNLKAVRLYEETNSLETIFHIISQAEEQRAWLIFYTHDISSNPSRYGCSPTYFEAVVKACVDRRLRVLTVRDALRLLEDGRFKNVDSTPPR